jgi:hypothetical protein
MIDSCRGCIRGEGAERAGATEQGTGLVHSHLGVLEGTGHLLALVGEIRVLTDTKLDHCPAQFRQHVVVGLRCIDAQTLESGGKQGISSQNGFGDTENYPDGLAVAAQTVPVHDVIVDKREIVDEFDRSGGLDGAFARASNRFRWQQNKCLPQCLAAGRIGRRPVGHCPDEMV